MPVHAIQLDTVQQGLLQSNEQTRHWCALLEAGGILYFPQTPVPIPAEDLQFLLGQRQTGSSLHKNIAYKPDRDQLSGVDKKTASPADLEQLHAVMRRYSALTKPHKLTAAIEKLLEQAATAPAISVITMLQAQVIPLLATAATDATALRTAIGLSAPA